MYTYGVPWADPEAAALREAQRLEIAERYGTDDSEPGIAPSADDIAYFVVTRDDLNTPIGCGGLRQLDEVSGEIKRMYVIPTARGTGAADAVIDALEAFARTQRWTHLRLETGDRQPDAVSFYRRRGYERIPNFGHYASSDNSLCFELEIG